MGLYPSTEIYLRNATIDEGECAGEAERTYQKDTFTAAAGQFIFTLSNTIDTTYPPMVYVNQQLQYYYMPDGVTVVLINACNVGDKLEIIYWT